MFPLRHLIYLISNTYKRELINMSTLGVVVVGMGRAGTARTNDLRQVGKWDQTKHVKLIGFVSRRQLEIEGVKQISMEEALSRDDVHVMIVSTENKTHYDLARKSIEAGKHVLVELPLATNNYAVKELQSLAKEKGVLCHEEVISLLLDSHRKMKDIIRSKPPLKEASVEFTASYNGWVEDFEGSGSPFTSGLSQLHNLYDLFGPLEAVSASLHKDDNGFICTGIVHTKDKKPITFITKRTKEKSARGLKLKYVFEDNSESEGIPPARPKDGPGLFMQDFIQFVEKLGKETSVVPLPEATLHCHQVADALYQMAQKKA